MLEKTYIGRTYFELWKFKNVFSCRIVGTVVGQEFPVETCEKMKKGREETSGVKQNVSGKPRRSHVRRDKEVIGSDSCFMLNSQHIPLKRAGRKTLHLLEQEQKHFPDGSH